MKFSDRLSRRFKQSYLDDLVMMLFVIVTAGMVSLIPLMFTVEMANSSANAALWGEAGLWSELGAKD
jgi:hypothetical protein